MGNKRSQFIPRLRPDKIEEIRKLYKTTDLSLLAIGRIFNRHHATILYHCRNLKEYTQNRDHYKVKKNEEEKLSIKKERELLYTQEYNKQLHPPKELDNIRKITRDDVKPIKTYKEYVAEDLARRQKKNNIIVFSVLGNGVRPVTASRDTKLVESISENKLI